MSVARGLVRLYPSPFRDQWGTALADDAAAAGFRSWPNLVASLADMWLHPAIWPARSRSQRRGRAAAMTIMITVASWLIAHLTTEPGAVAYARLLNGCAVVLLLGLVLVAPLPRLEPHAMLTILRRALRQLGWPVLLAASVVIIVNAVDVTGPVPRIVLLGCWWGSWLLGLVQGCRLVANLGPDVVLPPRPWRVRTGIVALAVAAAVAGSAVLVFALMGDHLALMMVALGVGLLAMASTPLLALRDLGAHH